MYMLGIHLLELTSEPESGHGEDVKSSPSFPRARPGCGRWGVPSMAARRVRLSLAGGGEKGLSRAVASMQRARTSSHALRARPTLGSWGTKYLVSSKTNFRISWDESTLVAISAERRLWHLSSQSERLTLTFTIFGILIFTLHGALSGGWLRPVLRHRPDRVPVQHPTAATGCSLSSSFPMYTIHSFHFILLARLDPGN
eukprot:2392279-Pleurochrysis_carterae.AAC.4